MTSGETKEDAMTIDTKVIIRYLEAQKQIFSIVPVKSDFSAGVIEGLNLLNAFIESLEK